ncbi:hypothetical protein V499_08335 [Pseudogymnoascus sp. VKM F-103]|nr:hypothetical protein V499_08335 [Pseudogymnoascus sp. VKM F-103]
MTGIPQKSRLCAFRTLELCMEFYEAYDGCCQLLQGDSPDADLMAYMAKEGFSPAVGVTDKSRFHSMMSKQLDINSKTLLKKVLSGFFLYHLVSSFGIGVLLLLLGNALRLYVYAHA